MADLRPETGGADDRDNDQPSVNLAGNSGLAQGIAAGIRGDQLTGKGILEAVGGIRGIFETLLPAVLYLATFIITQDARLSVIAPAVIALIFVVWRLARRDTLVTALSGVIGVAVCVATTLFTGRGEDYFLPGFWINGAWSLAIIVSLVVGWPILGFLVGALHGDFTAWRKHRAVKKAATVASLLWLVMFIFRLAVQLPLYFAEYVAALGIARLVMGTPLFALVILCTWLLFRNIPSTKPDDQE